MPNFIDKLNERANQKKEELAKTLRQDATSNEQSLRQLVQAHWHLLPKSNPFERRAAFAVDGSRAVRHLANGAYLFVAQALILGENQQATDVDVRILPGSTDSAVVERYAGLMMHRLEVGLVQENARQMPVGSVVFLDGALYGQMTSLYPLEENPDEPLPDDVRDLPHRIIAIYMDLFQTCAERQLSLISIAKTSHEEAHGQVWWRDQHGAQDMPRKISDSEMIYRWTDQRAGFSTPILFGKSAKYRGAQRILLAEFKDAPAVVSFFVRLADFDDALRIDVPVSAVGRAETIGEIETEQLLDENLVAPVLDLLLADYGGMEVYNAMLYSVDREVRLRQEMMDQVYVNVIQGALGNEVEIRLDRSERRFHSM